MTRVSPAADDVVLTATKTVTIGTVKAGLTRGEGPRLSGRIVLVEIGLTVDPTDTVGQATVSEIRRGTPAGSALTMPRSRSACSCAT